MKIKVLIAGALLCAGLGGPALAAPRVVASIAPVHSIAAQIMEGIATPELLLEATASPHHFALKPSQAAALARADLIVMVGPRLEEGLMRAVEDKADTLLVLAPDPAGNPHIWLDPRAGVRIGKQIAERLSQIDPDNAARYRANEAAATVRLLTLYAVLREELSAYQGVQFVVVHDAYSAFERAMGLAHMGSLEAHEDLPPSAKRVAALRTKLKAHPGACIFAEPQFSSRRVEALAQGTGARIGRLDPLGVDLAPGPELYEALLRQLVVDFTACFPT